MLFNKSTIDYVKTLRLCDVIESLTEQNLYYKEPQIKALEALYYLLDHDHCELVPMIDGTIKIETIRDSYIDMIIKQNGDIRVFTATRKV